MMQKIIIKGKSRAGNAKPKGILIVKSDEISQAEANRIATQIKSIYDSHGVCVIGVPEHASVNYIRL